MIVFHSFLYVIVTFTVLVSSLIFAYPIQRHMEQSRQQEWDYLEKHIADVVRTLLEPLPSDLPESPDIFVEPSEEQTVEFNTHCEEPTEAIPSFAPSREYITWNISASAPPVVAESPCISEEDEPQPSATSWEPESHVNYLYPSVTEENLLNLSLVPSVPSLTPEVQAASTFEEAVEVEADSTPGGALPNLCSKKLRKCLSRWRCDIYVQRRRQRSRYRRSRIHQRFCRLWCRLKLRVC